MNVFKIMKGRRKGVNKTYFFIYYLEFGKF